MATYSATCTYNESEATQSDGARKQPDALNGRTIAGNTTDSTDSIHDDINTVQQQTTGPLSLDEIPEQIKELDDIISEFEETTKPVAVVNGENQSEDDGYMSLSRKNMHKKHSEEMPETNFSCASLEAPGKSFTKLDICGMSNGDQVADTTATDKNLIQTTLPKARQNTSIGTNYSSLPCCGARSGALENKLRVGSCNGDRNVLGIDISAVHKAVLRGGVAKLPERMLNEHPVTIYPGRYSPPTGGNRPQRLISSVEKHKEVCHILNPVSSMSSSASSSSGPSSTSSSSGDPNKLRETSPRANLMQKPTKEREFLRNPRRSMSEYDFSDDSLEERSLSPPQTISSLTTHQQLAPNKQTGIAWEINFNNLKEKSPSPVKDQPPPVAQNIKNNFGTAWEIDFGDNAKKSKPPRPQLRKATAANKPRSKNTYHKSEPLLVVNVDDDESTSSSIEKLNYCMSRQANMLGKGTFIIRRATKKDHPKVADIFKPPVAVAVAAAARTDTKSTKKPTNESPLSPKKSARKGTDSNEIYRKTEVMHSKPRHSLELGGTQSSSLTSPRDRLSLNFDSPHSNSLNNKKAALPMLDRKSPEEFIKSQRKEGSLKRTDSQKSVEHLSDRSPSVEKDSLSKDAKSFDLYSYKNNSNGVKEYSDLRSSNTTTPHTDLAPTLEEEEEQLSDISYGCEPLRRIESNISALLRGEISVVRAGDVGGAVAGGSGAAVPPKRPLEFRPGVHKSESAKEMLLSQTVFGPLPPSPPSSNPDAFDYDDLPPLPPTPTDTSLDDDASKSYVKTTTTSAEIHIPPAGDELRIRETKRNVTDELPLPPPNFENIPPAVPPHRGGHSANTMKSWSIDSNYRRRSPKMLGYGSGITTPTTGPMPPASYEAVGGGCGGGVHSTKRYVSYGTKRSLKQSPREEQRLQTSCSLPETPIFARGCDIPRTPFRRQNENAVSGSRTAPRSSTSHSINMGTSIVGISGGSAYGTGLCQRQRSINHALASNEMLRLSGVPARGWYPKQRTMRPASTENIDRLTSIRVWDSAAGMSGTGTHARKPLTLPPNLTPSFLNKSPREALRRVTSLLITKKKNTKERKNKPYSEPTVEPAANSYDVDTSSSAKNASRSSSSTAGQKPPKKKGIFKNLWKKTKHFSLDQ